MGGMAPMPLELTLPPEAASIGRARQAVRAFGAELGADPVAVAQAVTEAVSNIVLDATHSASRSSGSIVIRAECTAGQLLVSVSHAAPGSTPNSEPSGIGLGISTIGLALIGGFADSVEIEPSDRGAARLLMTFKLARSD
jgi:anti-sigma regulatory factor (Ser/Thr protein kinase)